MEKMDFQFTRAVQLPGQSLALLGRAEAMIDRREFAKKQFEIAAEFGKYVFAHPEVDERMPDGAFVYFEIEGEPDFSQYSRELAAKQRSKEGVPVVLVHVKGLAPPQPSRLIDPVIEAVSAPA